VTALADMPEVLTVEETAAILRLGRGSAYLAVRAGEIPSIKLGRKRLVPRARLEAMLTHNDDDPATNGAAGKEGDAGASDSG
jgi:excisionase family DNA binding protein